MTELLKRKNEHIAPKLYIGILKGIMCMLLGFVLSGGSIDGVELFFATAYVAACGSGRYGVFALLGGALNCVRNDIGIELVASMMAYTVSFVCKYTVLSYKRFFMPIVASVLIFVSLLFGNIAYWESYAAIITIIVCQSIFVGCMTYVFSELRVWSDKDDEIIRVDIKLVIAGVCLVLSTNNIFIIDTLSVGEILSHLLLCIAISTYSEISYIVSACLLGVSSVLIRGSMTVLLFDLGVSIFCMLIGIRSKAGVIFIYLASLCFMILITYGGQEKICKEIMIALIVYCIIPSRVLKQLKNRIYGTDIYSNKINAITNNSIDFIYRVLSDVYEYLSLEKCESNDYSVADALESGFVGICSKCYKRDMCWMNHQEEHQELFAELECIAENRGILKNEDLKCEFRNYCPYEFELIDEINGALRRNYEDVKNKCRLNKQHESVCDLINLFLRLVKYENLNGYEYSKETSAIAKMLSEFFARENVDIDYHVSFNQKGQFSIDISDNDKDIFLKNEMKLNELSSCFNKRLRMFVNEQSGRLSIMEAEPYAVSVGVACKKKRGEKVCGDQTSYFKTNDGCFYVILSDGMGSGEEAAGYSALLIHMLKNFILSGLNVTDSIKLAQIIFALNNSSLINGATLDLLEIDLYSGIGRSYKLGASPTFICSDSRIYEIGKSDVSVGFDAAHREEVIMEQVQFSPGDILVMTSDGVCILEKDRFCELIGQEYCMKILARSILIDVEKNYACNDDMTAITVRLEHRA